MNFYPKIPGPYKRSEDGKTLTTSYSEEYIAEQALEQWHVEEKLDGTNIAVRVENGFPCIYGRTERAAIPATLVNYVMSSLLNWRDSAAALMSYEGCTFFGEGVGPGIQNGDRYHSDVRLVLFDVVSPKGEFLRSEDVSEAANIFTLERAPVIGQMCLPSAIDLVSAGLLSKYSESNPALSVMAEGLVLKRTVGGLRYMVKVKARDFYKGK